MTYALGAKSRGQLAGVHPDLVRVVELAITLTAQDFAVNDGVRTLAEQQALVTAGASRTLDSAHRVQADGYGHAVDLVPYIAGRLRWEWPAIYVVAVAVRRAALELGVPLTWGAVWDRDVRDLSPDVAGLMDDVAAYSRRKNGRPFLDGPHWQIRP